MDKFIDCLQRSSREASGHEELADLLQRDVDRDRDNPDLDKCLQIPAPRLSTINAESQLFMPCLKSHGIWIVWAPT